VEFKLLKLTVESCSYDPKTKPAENTFKLLVKLGFITMHAEITLGQLMNTLS
jgi:hypothetical protein